MMNSARVISRLFVRKTIPQVRNAHGTHDKYVQKAAKCYLEGHEPYTDIGYNLPFNIHCSPYALWLKFFLFFGSGFWLPFASYHYARVGSLR